VQTWREPAGGRYARTIALIGTEKFGRERLGWSLSSAYGDVVLITSALFGEIIWFLSPVDTKDWKYLCGF
jgi:hypothetical protein